MNVYDCIERNNFNRPYSYSHGCTGNEHEREAGGGNHFKCKLSPPHEPPSHARSSSTVTIRIWSIDVILMNATDMRQLSK